MFHWYTHDIQMCHGETSHIQVCRSDTPVFPVTHLICRCVMVKHLIFRCVTVTHQCFPVTHFPWHIFPGHIFLGTFSLTRFSLTQFFLNTFLCVTLTHYAVSLGHIAISQWHIAEYLWHTYMTPSMSPFLDTLCCFTGTQQVNPWETYVTPCDTWKCLNGKHLYIAVSLWHISMYLWHTFGLTVCHPPRHTYVFHRDTLNIYSVHLFKIK